MLEVVLASFSLYKETANIGGIRPPAVKHIAAEWWNQTAELQNVLGSPWRGSVPGKIRGFFWRICQCATTSVSVVQQGLGEHQRFASHKRAKRAHLPRSKAKKGRTIV